MSETDSNALQDQNPAPPLGAQALLPDFNPDYSEDLLSISSDTSSNSTRENSNQEYRFRPANFDRASSRFIQSLNLEQPVMAPPRQPALVQQPHNAQQQQIPPQQQPPQQQQLPQVQNLIHNQPPPNLPGGQNAPQAPNAQQQQQIKYKTP